MSEEKHDFNEVYALLFGEQYSDYIGHPKNKIDLTNHVASNFFDIPNNFTDNSRAPLSRNLTRLIGIKTVSFQRHSKTNPRPKASKYSPRKAPEKLPAISVKRTHSIENKGEVKSLILDPAAILQQNAARVRIRTVPMNNYKSHNSFLKNKSKVPEIPTLKNKLLEESLFCLKKAKLHSHKVRIASENRQQGKKKINVRMEMPKEMEKTFFDTFSQVPKNKKANLTQEIVKEPPSPTFGWPNLLNRSKIENKKGKSIHLRLPSKIMLSYPDNARSSRESLSLSQIKQKGGVNPMFYDNVRKKIKNMMVKKGMNKLDLPIRVLLALHHPSHNYPRVKLPPTKSATCIDN